MAALPRYAQPGRIRSSMPCFELMLESAGRSGHRPKWGLTVQILKKKSFWLQSVEDVYMGPCTPVEIRRGFKFKEDEEALKKYRALKKI